MGESKSEGKTVKKQRDFSAVITNPCYANTIIKSKFGRC